MNRPGPRAARVIGVEAVAFAFVGGFTLVIGAAAGLIWAGHAGHPSVAGLLEGDPGPDSAIFDQQMLYALLMVIGGLLAAAVLLVSRRVSYLARQVTDGPGAVLGLTVGGLLGSLAAAAIGHRQRLGSFVAVYDSAVHRLAPSLPHQLRLYYLRAFELRLHAMAMIVILPLVAVLVTSIARYATADPSPR